MPLCHSANVRLGRFSEARGAQPKISGWTHDELNDSRHLFRHLLLLYSFSLCCTTWWDPVVTTLVRTSQWSSSLSLEKSSSPECQSVTKLCSHWGHGLGTGLWTQTLHITAEILSHWKEQMPPHWLANCPNCWNTGVFFCSGWPPWPLLL